MPSHFPSFLASHWSIPTWFWVIQARGKEMVQIPSMLTQEHDSEAIEAPGGNGAFISLSDTSAPEHHRPEDLRPGKKSRLNWPLGDQLILPSLLRQPSVLSLPAFPKPQNEFLKVVFWCIFPNLPEIRCFLLFCYFSSLALDSDSICCFLLLQSY